MGRSKKGEARRIASMPKGKNHYRWSKNPSKLALHKRLYRKHGKAKDRKCAKCPKQANDWANITGNYTDDIKDYLPLCRSCHIKLDYTEERREKIRQILIERHKKKEHFNNY